MGRCIGKDPSACCPSQCQRRALNGQMLDPTTTTTTTTTTKAATTLHLALHALLLSQPQSSSFRLSDQTDVIRVLPRDPLPHGSPDAVARNSWDDVWGISALTSVCRYNHHCFVRLTLETPTTSKLTKLDVPNTLFQMRSIKRERLIALRTTRAIRSLTCSAAATPATPPPSAAYVNSLTLWPPPPPPRRGTGDYCGAAPRISGESLSL
jgi:hypothetical protein